MKVLVLFAHPAFHKSRVNKLLLEGLDQVEQVTFHDLYETYPEFDIDVDREQRLLLEHQVIVFQFPLFWYSTPAILKEWQDLVLQHGWAYGSKGNALKGKLFLCSLTSGGPRSGYEKGGFHNYSLNDLLAPLERTAALCKMLPLPPFVVHGTHTISQEEVLAHRTLHRKLITEFTTGQFDATRAKTYPYLNDYLQA